MTEEEIDLRAQICNACKARREQSGISMSAFARKHNVDRQEVWYFENRPSFTVRLFQAYHEDYGITIEEFLT